MSLEPGSSIGPYSIVREIGRGGMGVVYLARDPRLDRDVAIKALPEHLALDADRLARFQSEARTLAQLNSQSIAGIHGVEEVDGHRFLVLEYVEGESLADRLDRGALPLDDALEICGKIAAGLEAAHDAGVIHRDLKPDNVRITPVGEVKVLDFGLAKTFDGSASGGSSRPESHSPTMTTAQAHSPTMPGTILGTAPYMSPEQARGRRVDKRSDIWSFGVVLYECLTGRNPFRGESPQESIGAILHTDADLELLPEQAPRAVHRVLRRCLERDLSQRYRDIGDVRIELARAATDDEADARVRPAKARLAFWPAIAVATAAALLAGAAVWFAKPAGSSRPLPVLQAEVELPEGQRLAHAFQPGLAISPDGQTLAFFAGAGNANWVWPQQLMVRHLDQPDAIPVAGAAVGGAAPVFSPDGASLAYATGDGLFSVPVTGGQPTKLASITNPAGWSFASTVGLSWSEDDSIIAGNAVGGLFRVPAVGGTVETITEIDSAARETSHRLPHFLPGGRAVLFTVLRFDFELTTPAAWSVWSLRLETGQRARVIEQASDARYVDGHIVFIREGSLYAAPFDPDRLELTGDPRLVLQGVHHALYTSHTGTETGAGLFALSPTGALAYVAGSVTPEEKGLVVLVDRDGNETSVEIEPGGYGVPRGSPDGRNLLVFKGYQPTRAVWLHDLERGLTSRQVSGAGFFAAWGPEQDEITYARTSNDGLSAFFSKTVGTGSANETEIEFPEGTDMWLCDWSRDGKYLMALEASDMKEAHVDGFVLWAYSRDEGWTQIIAAGGVGWPALSPDTRWLAYGSVDLGDSFEVAVRPFPGKGATVQISRHGGSEPVWSRDGSELFYRGRDEDGVRWIMAVPVSTSGERLNVGSPVKLFKDVYEGSDPIRRWDVLSDGRFVFIKSPDEEARRDRTHRIFPRRIRIVQNWASSLD